MSKNIKWKGLYKLVEECGEVLQIAGKLGPFPNGSHPDGKGDMKERLEDELADLAAAMHYVSEENGLDAQRISERAQMKLDQFREWGLTGVRA